MIINLELNNKNWIELRKHLRGPKKINRKSKTSWMNTRIINWRIKMISSKQLQIKIKIDNRLASNKMIWKSKNRRMQNRCTKQHSKMLMKPNLKFFKMSIATLKRRKMTKELIRKLRKQRQILRLELIKRKLVKKQINIYNQYWIKTKKMQK